MRKFVLSLMAVLGFAGTSAFAQTSLSEAVAAGNKVFVQIVNDNEYPIPADEVADVIREFSNAGQWTAVETTEEADFILRVETRKKVVFNSPRTWMTPSVLDKESNVLWKGEKIKADATMFNGYKATNTCIRKVIENSFYKDLFKKAGRSVPVIE